MKCIYCSCEIIKQKKREHVMPQFLGTFSGTSLLLDEVCGDCNSAFSKELEDVCKKDSAEGILSAQFGLRKDSRVILQGNRYSTESEIESGDGLFDHVLPMVDIASGQIHKREQVVLKFENGQRQVLFADDPKFSENLRNFAKAKCEKFILAENHQRMTEIEEQILKSGMSYKRVATREIEEQDLDSIANKMTTQRIDVTVLRLMAKIGFNYFAHSLRKIGQLEACFTPAFDNVRKFARYGTGSNPVTVSMDELMCQDGWIPRTAPLHIVLWRRQDSLAIAEISLFALRRYTVFLGQLPEALMHLTGLAHQFDLKTHKIKELEVVLEAPPEVPEKSAFEWGVDVRPL